MKKLAFLPMLFSLCILSNCSNTSLHTTRDDKYFSTVGHFVGEKKGNTIVGEGRRATIDVCPYSLNGVKFVTTKAYIEGQREPSSFGLSSQGSSNGAVWGLEGPAVFKHFRVRDNFTVRDPSTGKPCQGDLHAGMSAGKGIIPTTVDLLFITRDGTTKLTSKFNMNSGESTAWEPIKGSSPWQDILRGKR